MRTPQPGSKFPDFVRAMVQRLQVRHFPGQVLARVSATPKYLITDSGARFTARSFRPGVAVSAPAGARAQPERPEASPWSSAWS